MRRTLVAIGVLTLVLLLATAAPAVAAKVTGSVSGSGDLSASSGATASLVVDAYTARGPYPAGGSFTWTAGGVPTTYAVSSAIMDDKGRISLYGTSAEGRSLHVVVEDRKSGDIVRSGTSGMMVTLWTVTSGDFRVR